MSAIDPKTGLKIANLTHRVALCTMQDVVNDNGTMVLSRPSVAWLWAAIKMARPSFISPYGYAVLEPADRATHIITIRGRAAIEVTSAAWVYEEFRKSPPRWYKIIGFSDDESWVRLTCHLVERSTTAQPSPDVPIPASPALAASPQGVVL